MQLSGQPRSQGSLLPVPGNEVVLSPFTGCVKSVKKLRCEMSYLYYHEKKSFLWWRLFLPGFWKLLKACWQPAEYQAFLEEKGEKKSENLLSRSPLEKPDTQTSLLKDQCISVVLRNYYFKQWIRSWTCPGPAQGEGLGSQGPHFLKNK